MDRVPVRFTQEKETLLATLYGRALDARSRRPILGDTMAAQTVDRIDYDFARLKITTKIAPNVAVRAKHFDNWAAEFLAEHDQATVPHLGAGLDTRVWRLAPGPGVLWYDVDYPEVVDLRRRLYSERENYQMIGSSVTAPGWLAQVPTDRPALVLAEGLTMYLKPDDGHDLLRRLTDHFVHGTVAFDSFNRMGIRMQKLNPAVRGSGSTLYWGIDDPHELERVNPRLRCVDVVRALYAPGTDALRVRQRLTAKVLWFIPAMRDISLYLRYSY